MRLAAGPQAGPQRLSLGGDRLLGITPTLRRQLAVTFFASLTSTAGAYAEIAFVLNTGYHVFGSTDSVGYDKYMQFYSKAWVVASRWEVRGVYIASGTNGAFVGAGVTTNSTSLGSGVAMIDNGLSKWTTAYVNPDRVRLSGRVDHSRFLGKPVYLDDPQLFCTSSAQPAQVIVLHLGVNALNSGTGTFEYAIEIVQDVVFTDPIPFT